MGRKLKSRVTTSGKPMVEIIPKENGELSIALKIPERDGRKAKNKIVFLYYPHYNENEMIKLVQPWT